MAIKSDAESVKVLPSDNQNITSEAPKLLLCSSIASGSDLGSNEGVTPLAGIGKEYPELSWYYLYLSNKELKRYISVFSGRKAVRFRTLSGSVEEEFFCFKVFSYTAADHRKRFEQCAYTKEEYTARRDSNRAVLKHHAEYYSTPAEVTGLLNDMAVYVVRDKEKFIAANLEEIRTAYSWEHLVDEHEKYFEWLLAQKR